MSKTNAFRADFGYPCRFMHTIQDGPVFRWGTEFEISASRNGVMVSGHSFCMKAVGLVSLRALLTLAEKIHEQLAENDNRQRLCFGSDNWVEKHEWTTAQIARREACS